VAGVVKGSPIFVGKARSNLKKSVAFKGWSFLSKSGPDEKKIRDKHSSLFCLAYSDEKISIIGCFGSNLRLARHPKVFFVTNFLSFCKKSLFCQFFFEMFDWLGRLPNYGGLFNSSSPYQRPIKVNVNDHSTTKRRHISSNKTFNKTPPLPRNDHNNCKSSFVNVKPRSLKFK